jgi:hypothetical protein
MSCIQEHVDMPDLYNDEKEEEGEGGGEEVMDIYICLWRERERENGTCVYTI